MPSTVVHAALAFVLAAALLGKYYDRKALLVVLVIVVLPELDTILGWWMSGAHRTVGHNIVFPAAAAFLLYYDTHVREESWLREQCEDWGVGADWGVRVAWVGLYVHVFAHVLLDYAHLDGINVFWPLWDRFFNLDGELYLSTADGLVQTFVEIAEEGENGTDVGETGTTEDVHVASPVDAAEDIQDEPDEPVDRRFPIAVHGWQLYVVVLGAFTLAAKKLQGEPPEEE